MTNNPRLNLNALEQKPANRRKSCDKCGHALPRSYTEDTCTNCQERILFQEVREYIRENNVTEMQVAEHFNLPLGTVKRWMNEHRIEYLTPLINMNNFLD